LCRVTSLPRSLSRRATFFEAGMLGFENSHQACPARLAGSWSRTVCLSELLLLCCFAVLSGNYASVRQQCTNAAKRKEVGTRSNCCSITRTESSSISTPNRSRQSDNFPPRLHQIQRRHARNNSLVSGFSDETLARKHQFS
jgi:hypothetical protein